MHVRSITYVTAAIAFSVLFHGQARAAASSWSQTDHGALRLVTATDAIGDSDRVAIGLQFRMKPGWKIYWRAPGDAGYPPQPDWKDSTNIGAVELEWPAPKRFTVLGLTTIGYNSEVVLPGVVVLREPGRPVQLRAHVSYLTCDDICVPYEAKLALDLPAGGESTAREARLIEDYRARVPRPADGSDIAIESAAAGGPPDAPVLRVVLRANSPLNAPDLFIDGPESLNYSVPRWRLSEGGKTAVANLNIRGANAAGIVGERLAITVVDGARAVEAAVAVASAPPGLGDFAALGHTGSQTLWLALGLALLGGLILNLMPCVLPMLSLKLLSIVGHAGESPARVRAGFLATALGVIASFLVLAAAAVGLKTAGYAAGWGIQFQQPWFLAIMATVLALFAANLFGLFEVRLPGMVANAAAGASGRGRPHTLGQHFLTGAFATLLATPCSAPFLGTAVGFALASGPAVIFLIFAALGVGLALPYLAVAGFPTIAAHLPRPGAWMLTLRRILGIVLLATAAWLVTLLVTITGGQDAPVKSAIAWRPFDLAAIGQMVESGNVVFVDVTADWCITCQVNKSLVLERGEVREALSRPGVIAMRADWTRPNPVIADYLASFGRYGIPFDAVYGPSQPHGEPLPEILSTRATLGALERAAR